MREGVEASAIIARLGMKRHPEGGWYAETFRDAATRDGRAVSTAIYFLLEEGESSAWHRVRDAVEIWHFHAGAPLELSIHQAGGPVTTVLLGTDLEAGERPQAIVPANWWQAARSTGAWTLVGCTVAPGFEFSSFELAPAGWQPSTGQSRA